MRSLAIRMLRLASCGIYTPEGQRRLWHVRQMQAPFTPCSLVWVCPFRPCAICAFTPLL